MALSKESKILQLDCWKNNIKVIKVYCKFRWYINFWPFNSNIETKRCKNRRFPKTCNRNYRWTGVRYLNSDKNHRRYELKDDSFNSYGGNRKWSVFPDDRKGCPAGWRVTHVYHGWKINEKTNHLSLTEHYSLSDQGL